MGGSHCGGRGWGNGDGGGRKCAGEGHGGSVADVDERWLAWPCAVDSEGEKRRGKCGGVGQLFEAEVMRQGGGSGSIPHGGQEQKRKRGLPARRRGHVVRPVEQGRGEGADQWAMAIVPDCATG
jgi:hypothetical protein